MYAIRSRLGIWVSRAPVLLLALVYDLPSQLLIWSPFRSSAIYHSIPIFTCAVKCPGGSYIKPTSVYVWPLMVCGVSSTVAYSGISTLMKINCGICPWHWTFKEKGPVHAGRLAPVLQRAERTKWGLGLPAKCCANTKPGLVAAQRSGLVLRLK